MNKRPLVLQVAVSEESIIHLPQELRIRNSHLKMILIDVYPTLSADSFIV